MFRLKCCLLYFLGISITESIANSIKRCKPTDYGCMVAIVQALIPQLANGIPELGIDSVDPLLIKTMHKDNNDLKVTLTNVKIYGASKCKLNRIQYIKETSTLDVELECPHAKTSQYEMSGTANSIPVYGKGNYKVETDKIKYFAELKLIKIEENGIKYWDVPSFEFRYELLTEIKFDFKNLYDGDEKRAKIFLDSINQNNREIFRKHGDKNMKQMVSNYIDEIKKIARKLPAAKFEIA